MQPLPLGKDIHGQVSSPDVHSIDQKREKEGFQCAKSNINMVQRNSIHHTTKMQSCTIYHS